MDAETNKIQESSNLKDLIPIFEFSKISGLVRQTVYNRMKKNQVFHVEIGGRSLLSRAEAEAIGAVHKKRMKRKKVRNAARG